MATTAEQIKTLRNKDPKMSAAQIAGELGISRERVRQLLLQLGLPTDTRIDRRKTKHRNYAARFGIELSSHTIGCISEMLVCADLLQKGWHVYRSISPHAPDDLVARREKKTVAVEVRSGRQNRAGVISCAKPIREKTWDVLAVVLPSGEIHYQPEIPK